jgi:hypothetical protein
MADIWEYRCESATVGRYFDEMHEYFLKPLGEQGWEAFHVSERRSHASDDESRHLKVYFKRRIVCDNES